LFQKSEEGIFATKDPGKTIRKKNKEWRCPSLFLFLVYVSFVFVYFEGNKKSGKMSVWVVRC
jgi:hypothetical protein